jgi:hypothetical protein
MKLEEFEGWFQWNKCHFIDCLDRERGLPALLKAIRKGYIEKFDLGYTDFPWGVGIGKTLSKGRNYVSGRELKPKKEKIYYKDNFNEFWNLAWFYYLRKICKAVILISSETHKYWWIRNTDPKGDITIHWVNGHAGSKIAKWSKKSTYLVYGDLPHKLDNDIIINQIMKWGFLSNWKGKHPSPKIGLTDLKFSLHYDIMEQIKPLSILDPFAGSGSFLYIANMLNIRWVGYEINKKAYKSDLNMRLAQTTLSNFIEG